LVHLHYYLPAGTRAAPPLLKLVPKAAVAAVAPEIVRTAAAAEPLMVLVAMAQMALPQEL
jgi:hypothetical protein